MQHNNPLYRMMQNVFILLLISGIGTLLAGCNENKKQTMITQDNTSLFPKGNQTPADYFTGKAFLYPLLARDKNNEFAMGSVSFEPVARTNWHTHPKGQVLIVTDGSGYYQEKGKPARTIHKGDVINIPENVEHWHAASAGSGLVHIAITNYKGEENVVWLQPVTDEEYKAANQQ